MLHKTMSWTVTRSHSQNGSRPPGQRNSDDIVASGPHEILDQLAVSRARERQERRRPEDRCAPALHDAPLWLDFSL